MLEQENGWESNSANQRSRLTPQILVQIVLDFNAQTANDWYGNFETQFKQPLTEIGEGRINYRKMLAFCMTVKLIRQKNSSMQNGIETEEINALIAHSSIVMFSKDTDLENLLKGINVCECYRKFLQLDTVRIAMRIGAALNVF